MTTETVKDYGAQWVMRDEIPDEVLAAAQETGTAPVDGAVPVVEEGTVTSTKKATKTKTKAKAPAKVKAAATAKTTKAPATAAAPWTMPKSLYTPGTKVKYVGGARAPKVAEGTTGWSRTSASG